jgi:glycosyltransferase involved in cell wall biosynthesis
VKVLLIGAYNMKTIAIIPAHNEELHIAEVIRGVRKFVNKVIVVDDGSNDRTKYESRNADKIVSHMINLGKGMALRTGFDVAIDMGADIIITIDGDMQNDPEDIPRFIKALKKTNSDIIIGKRVISKNAPITARIGNVLLTNFFSILYRTNLSDTQSGYRAFKAGVYQKILWKSSGYTVETEMLANARKHNLKCREIPIKARYLDKVKGTTVIDGVKIFANMLFWRLKQ